MNDAARLTAHWVRTTDTDGRARVEMRWVRVSVPVHAPASPTRVPVPAAA